MKLSLATGAALSALACSLIPAVASADDVVVTPAPQPTTTVVAAPATQPVATEQTTSQASGPSMAMVGSGLVIFGLSYIPAAIVGGSSGLDADRTLLVPVAGPWMDLAQRPGCNQNGSSCNGENTNKVLLVTDGVFQAIGVLTTIGGFLTPAHQTTTVQQSAKTEPTVHVTPASLGTGYGMAAIGTF